MLVYVLNCKLAALLDMIYFVMGFMYKMVLLKHSCFYCSLDLLQTDAKSKFDGYHIVLMHYVLLLLTIAYYLIHKYWLVNTCNQMYSC